MKFSIHPIQPVLFPHLNSLRHAVVLSKKCVNVKHGSRDYLDWTNRNRAFITCSQWHSPRDFLFAGGRDESLMQWSTKASQMVTWCQLWRQAPPNQYRDVRIKRQHLLIHPLVKSPMNIAAFNVQRADSGQMKSHIGMGVWIHPHDISASVRFTFVDRELIEGQCWGCGDAGTEINGGN